MSSSLRLLPLAILGLAACLPSAHSAQDLSSFFTEGNRERLTPHTALFVRGQFKAGLEPQDHYNRYIDRPLFLSIDAHNTAERRFLHDLSLAQRYQLDGFAFFPQNRGCELIYGYMQKNSAPRSFQLLTELYPNKSEKDIIAFAGKALESPYSYRVNGKVVLSSYNADRQTPKYWQDLMAKIRAAHGDHFLFVPCVTNFAKEPLGEWLRRFDQGEITQEQWDRAMDHWREWARATDGLYFASTTIVRDDRRRFDHLFYRDFVVAGMKAVLSEPEFEGKIFGLSAKVGHENHTRIGRTLNSDGTKTFRRSVEISLDAGAEYVNIPEWDELNESTNLMPTLYDGLVWMRLTRYYQSGGRGQPPAAFPGDDQSIPNLVLSYRKSLSLGELLEIEVLQIPDGADSAPQKAQVKLYNAEDKEVYSSPVYTFESGKLMDHTLTLPSEKLAPELLLRVGLEVELADGTKKLYRDGMSTIEIRPTQQHDYKWVRQALRDILPVSKAEFELSPGEEPGVMLAKVDLAAEEPLAAVEVLENEMAVYSHDEKAENRFRDNAEEVFFSVSWKSADGYRDRATLNATLTLEDGEGRWLRGPAVTEAPISIEGTRLKLDGVGTNIGTGREGMRQLLAVKRSSLEKAVLIVQQDQEEPLRLPLSELMKNEKYALSGPNSRTLMIQRFARQRNMPSPLDRKEVQFTIPIIPEKPGSSYQVQAIAKSGRIYRSKPIRLSPGDSAGKTAQVRIISEHDGKPVSVSYPAAEVPRFKYEFNPRHGALLATSAGHPYWGILGGYVTLYTMRGASPGDGSHFHGKEPPFGHPDTAPKWVELEDGGYALKFDGKGSNVTLPMGVISRRAGYTLSMEIRPEQTRQRATLFANYVSRFGTLELVMSNGEIHATHLRDLENRLMKKEEMIPTGVKLEAGKWQKLTVRYDQETLRVSVDGVESEAIPLPGPGMHDTVTSIGGRLKDNFEGLIRSLEIDYALPEGNRVNATTSGR